MDWNRVGTSMQCLHVHRINPVIVTMRPDWHQSLIDTTKQNSYLFKRVSCPDASGLFDQQNLPCYHHHGLPSDIMHKINPKQHFVNKLQDKKISTVCLYGTLSTTVGPYLSIFYQRKHVICTHKFKTCVPRGECFRIAKTARKLRFYCETQ